MISLADESGSAVRLNLLPQQFRGERYHETSRVAHKRSQLY